MKLTIDINILHKYNLRIYFDYQTISVKLDKIGLGQIIT